MQVIKFNPEAIANPAGIINLAEIARKQHTPTLILVDAIGNTHTLLGNLAVAYNSQHQTQVEHIFNEVKHLHYELLHHLFSEHHEIFIEVNNSFVEIDWMLEEEPQDSLEYIYDQMVTIGQLTASRIVAAYLNKCGLKSHWLDARSYIHTDNAYQQAVVDIAKTQYSINTSLPLLLEQQFVVTQANLGGTSENFSTTLGDNGSDYSAALFAHTLNAQLLIWDTESSFKTANVEQLLVHTQA